MDESEGQGALLARLKTAEGHLHAVIGMVENGASCEQILHQLNAVCAALRVAGRTLVKYQLQTSAHIITENTQVHVRLAEVQRLAHLYGLWLGRPIPKETICDDSTLKH